jgi:peptidoglycan/LPS O-acetylase OafA/YrhL
MKATSHKTERIYALDSLRAILMLIGIIFHTTLTYRVNFVGGWSLHDPMGDHILNDYITDFVHSFRMQHFYLIAGFFGAMLFYDRGALQIIKNRFSRIVLPFVLFLLILYPLCNLAREYSELIFSGSDSALEATLAEFSFPDSLIPETTKHLWFLYYLILFTASSICLGVVFKKLPSFSNRISKAFNWVMQQTKFRILILSGITFLIYSLIDPEAIEDSFYYLIPDLSVFTFYFFFYLAGWVLFKSKHLLKTMMRSDWICAIIGLILFSVHFYMEESINEILSLKLIIKALTSWLFIFGVTGLFLRYGSNYSKRMRYISDSSYWVYLLHLPLTLVIPGLIADWPLPANLKLLIVVTITSIICFGTYHYLVRGTFIGKFLNGRKYPTKSSDRKEPEVSSKLKPVLNNEL